MPGCSRKPGIIASKRLLLIALSIAALSVWGVRSTQILPIRWSTAARVEARRPTPRAAAQIVDVSAFIAAAEQIHSAHDIVTRISRLRPMESARAFVIQLPRYGRLSFAAGESRGSSSNTTAPFRASSASVELLRSFTSSSHTIVFFFFVDAWFRCVLPDVLEALAQARRQQFASDAEVEAAFRRFDQ